MKYYRHSKILEIIENNVIETQEELAEKLRECGIDVTQATVSRDIKELRLIKVMAEDGRYRYASIYTPDSDLAARLRTIFAESVVGVDRAMNIIVIKTLSGMAQAAASAIDTMNWPEIVGSIAGDDTILVITRNEKNSIELAERFKRMMR
ncbi:MAG: arginine repressor [Clostridiaceae bacterium]|nr:arginine repressor [Clostridiaceae bacterium]